jgi:hypothetical protein
VGARRRFVWGHQTKNGFNHESEYPRAANLCAVLTKPRDLITLSAKPQFADKAPLRVVRLCVVTGRLS